MPRWIPDTCSNPPCRILVKDDWSAADGFENKCSFHAALDDATAFTAIRNANTLKNQISDFVRAQVPNYFGAFTQDAVGTTVRIFLPNVQQQIALQNALNTQFGAGVAKVAFVPVKPNAVNPG